MKLDGLRRKLAEVGLTAEEWNIFVSCLCMEGFMVRKHTGNATNSKHAGRLPVRGCYMVHDSDETAANCGLFYPPDKQYDGRHEFDMGQYRPRPGEDPEQSHVVGQQAQLALVIAEFYHCSDMVKARIVNVDICSGTQSQAHSNLRLSGITVLSYDKRPTVMAFGAPVQEEPEPTAWGGVRRALAAKTTTPSRAGSACSVGRRPVLHGAKRSRAAHHGCRIR